MNSVEFVNLLPQPVAIFHITESTDMLLTVGRTDIIGEHILHTIEGFLKCGGICVRNGIKWMCRQPVALIMEADKNPM
jgi:hypothetical protein